MSHEELRTQLGDDDLADKVAVFQQEYEEKQEKCTGIVQEA